MRTAISLVIAVGVAFAGFSSLKVMPGAREAGMGNVGVAVGDGPQSMVWNPAATAQVGTFAACATYAKWLLDTNQQSVYLVRNFRFMRLGIGAAAFNAGEFEYRTEVPTTEPLGVFTPSELNFHLNLSRSIIGIVDAGLSGRFYYSKVMDDVASSVGLDAGLRVRPVDGLALGVSVTDFARNPVYYRESFRLPFRARLGAAYELCLGDVGALDLSSEGSYLIFDNVFNIHAGAEFVWNGLLAARAGYEWLDGDSRLGLGLGLILGTFRVDYSFTPLSHDLGAAHRFAVGIGG